MKILVLVTALVLVSCDDVPDVEIGLARPAAAPSIGTSGGTDAADLACVIALRSIGRRIEDDGTGEYVTRCDDDGVCTWLWDGTVEVATSVLESGGSVSVLYRVDDSTWWEVPASANGFGLPGYSALTFTLEEHVFGPEILDEDEPWQHRIELTPFYRGADGSRLFDHNFLRGGFENYLMTFNSGYRAGGDGYTCTRRPETAAIRFFPGWYETVLGTPRAGGRLAVQYDVERGAWCRSGEWDVTAYARFRPSGDLSSGSVRAFSGEDAYSAPLELDVPDDATSVELWFRHASSDCEWWDSNYGQNYSFDVGVSRDDDPCSRVETWEDRHGGVPTCPGYEVRESWDATHCELFVEAVGNGYEGHYGIPFRWLEAYVSTDAPDGELLNVGMWVEYFDHATGVTDYAVRLGHEIEPNYWLTGMTHHFTAYMGSMSYRYTIGEMAFFADVRRPNGQVARLWQSRSGANYSWDDAFSLPPSTLYIPYGRIEYAHPDSVVLESSRDCQ